MILLTQMLTQAFCTFLEFRITKAFAHCTDEKLKGFWCDGILLPAEEYYSQKFVNDNRKITATAFLGKTGQDRYELEINFGKKSLSRFARGLDITECVPDPEHSDWFTVDPGKRKLIIQLD